MSEYTVADVSYDQDGELEQFLLFWDDGEPETRRATAENVLLFDPEDELPFDGGMQDFFNGDSAIRVSDEPEIVVNQTGDEYSYVLAVGDNVVETTPEQAEELLDGVYDALAEDSTAALTSLHASILDEQVRQRIVNAIKKTFSSHDRITIASNGWLVDGFYLVDWNANIYVDTDDTNEADYIRKNDTVIEADKTYEFVQLEQAYGESIDCDDVSIGGETYTLTEREMVFLAKVTWLLDRETYHPDESFWLYADQWADTAVDDPDLEVFDL